MKIESSSVDRGAMRTWIACALACASGIFAYTIVAGITGSWPGAAGSAAIVALIVGWRVRTGHIVVLDEAACSRGLGLVGLVATIVALVHLGRLAVFMVDPTRPDYSSVPSSKWEVQHSCLSAYFVAAGAADHVPNVYADSLYTRPDDDPSGVRKARMLGPFRIDVYEYPPPFLLLPRALRRAVPDFVRFRAVWFGLNAAIVLLVILVLVRLLGRTTGTRALLLSPLVWAALPTLSTLQKGNVQAVIIMISLLAMALFQGRRAAAGGALLAFATVSKLYPGLLIVYLLVRRQWRATLWTVALALGLVALTLADTGLAMYREFLHHLPGLLGGEAFPAFRNPMAMAINHSIPGLVFKLGLFGVPGMGFATAKLVGWIYTLIVIASILTVARRSLGEGPRPQLWTAILVLATLRSPFLPQAYAAFPSLVLLVLLGAERAPTPRVLATVLSVWLVLNIYWPMDRPIDARLLAVLSSIPQAMTIMLAIFALRRGSREAPAFALG